MMHERKSYKGITTKRILKKIGCPHLHLTAGYGDNGRRYYYWTYDTFPKDRDVQYPESEKYMHETHTDLFAFYLAHRSLDEWVKSGKGFVEKMEIMKQDPENYSWEDPKLVNWKTGEEYYNH